MKLQNTYISTFVESMIGDNYTSRCINFGFALYKTYSPLESICFL